MAKRIFFILILFSGCVFSLGCKTNQVAGPAVQLAKSIPVEAKVLILIYHQIRPITSAGSLASQQFIMTPQNFEKQLQELKTKNYQTISFKNLADYFAGNYSLPEKPVIISFDDGTASQYANAFPLLKKYGLTATFFVFTNAISRNERYVTWEQLKEMAAAGMEIGSHTRFHQYLTKQAAKDLLAEIAGSKETLEKNLGVTVTALSYPFGDKNEQIIQMVKDAGYAAARDIVNGAAQEKEDLFKLKAYFVTSDFKRFGWILSQ